MLTCMLLDHLSCQYHRCANIKILWFLVLFFSHTFSCVTIFYFTLYALTELNKIFYLNYFATFIFYYSVWTYLIKLLSVVCFALGRICLVIFKVTNIHSYCHIPTYNTETFLENSQTRAYFQIWLRSVFISFSKETFMFRSNEASMWQSFL